jgi:hypothetical protein
MDTQQIVLIILGILYFLFRSSGDKSKKSKPRPQNRGSDQHSSSEKRTTSIEDILRELSGQSQEVPQIKKTPVKEKANTETKVPYKPPVNVESKKVDPIEPVIAESVDKKESKNINFDLRKAVIYDAVLNRPHQ